MNIILFIIYILFFIFLIVKLIKCLKNKASWKMLFLLEFFSIIISFVLMRYYDSLPGSGFMPGLTYLGEWIACFGATILFVAMLVISTIIKLIKFIVNKKRK